MSLRPCLSCGSLCSGSRCEECQPVQLSSTRRGYGSSWAKLSKRCRSLAPFCAEPGCGSTENLTLDHTPAAWAKVAAGKTLTMQDAYNGLLVVRCQACNNRAGPARGRWVTRS
jgi:hypothetical protein